MKKLSLLFFILLISGALMGCGIETDSNEDTTIKKESITGVVLDKTFEKQIISDDGEVIKTFSIDYSSNWDIDDSTEIPYFNIIINDKCKIEFLCQDERIPDLYGSLLHNADVTTVSESKLGDDYSVIRLDITSIEIRMEPEAKTCENLAYYAVVPNTYINKTALFADVRGYASHEYGKFITLCVPYNICDLTEDEQQAIIKSLASFRETK